MADVKALVFVLDSEHAEDARSLIRHPVILRKNQDVKELLCAWLTAKEHLPFLVIGFIPTQRGGTGGMSADWKHAIGLCGLVKARLDDVNNSGVTYLSQWMIMVTDERRRELGHWMGEAQSCEGSA